MSSAAVFAGLLFVGLALTVFARLLGELQRTGGKVRVDLFGFPELLSSLVLVAFFIWLIAKNALAGSAVAAPKVTIKQVLPNALFFVILAGGMAAFLKYRGIALRNALGVGALPWHRVGAWALGLICAAFPILLMGSALMQSLIPDELQEQELVSLFREAAQHADYAGIAQIVFAGAVIAPLCEEFLFRGFFYAVGKRSLGAVASALLTSALFAAFHLNLAALPSLFLLSLAFIIAYERTGSLLVPITMHALFNASQLAFLYYLAQHPPAA